MIRPVVFIIVCSLLVVISSPEAVNAWNYTTRLNRDKRVAVVLGVFGHSEFGRTEVTVRNLVLEANMRARLAAKVWLELRPVRTASNARKLKQLIEKEDEECDVLENTPLLSDDGSFATASSPSSPSQPTPPMKHYLKFLTSQVKEEDEELRSSVTFVAKNAGLYALVYARCISLASTSLPGSGSPSLAKLNKRNNNNKKKGASTSSSNDLDSDSSTAAPPPPPTMTPQADDSVTVKRKRSIRVSTSAHFTISQWNPVYSGSSSETGLGATYLSVGEAPLPTVYGCFALLFAAGAYFWFRDLQKCNSSAAATEGGGGRPSRIHYAMLLVAALKAATLLLQAGVYAHRNKTGGTGDFVDVVFVIVAAAKTAVLFVIVILLGSGWSISRASLGETERQLVVGVLIVQLVVNIALAVIEDTSPAASEKVAAWRNWLRLADLVCALVVLVPIVTRAKSQHEAAVQGGDKARREAQRLTVFRSFYIITFVFLYWTRVVVPYLESHVPYLLAWLPHFLYELAAVVFYVVAMKLFHPASETWALPSGGADERQEMVFAPDEQPKQQQQQQPQRTTQKQKQQFGTNPNELEELELG